VGPEANGSDRRRYLIVGAGAVGQLLGSRLARRGHDVAFLLRPGRSLAAITSRDLDHGTLHTLDEPATLSPGDALDPPHWVLIAVRAEQLDGALEVSRPYLGSDTGVAVVPPLLHDLVPRVRKAGVEQATVAMLVTFGAWPVGSELHWFRVPLAHSQLSAEGDPRVLPRAEGLAEDLRDAGIPAAARLSISESMRGLVAGEYALVMGWELAGWDIDQLIADAELCALTEAAMEEASRILLGDSPRAPASTAPMPLGQRAAFMGEHFRAIWRVHGPKITEQTRYLADALLREASSQGIAADRLRELRTRLR